MIVTLGNVNRLVIAEMVEQYRGSLVIENIFLNVFKLGYKIYIYGNYVCYVIIETTTAIEEKVTLTFLHYNGNFRHF